MTTRARNMSLWTLQIVLALLFVMAGVSKLAMSDADLTRDSQLPVLFLRFIAVCELLGSVGLVLPWALRIRPALTPLAAACLAIIMVGAVVVSALTVSVPLALFPLIVGVLLAYVGNARWKQLREAGVSVHA